MDFGQEKAVAPITRSTLSLGFSAVHGSQLTHDEVVRKLARFGCERVGDAGDEHGLWMLEGRCCFTVPELGKDKRCPAEVLNEIINFIERSNAPVGSRRE
jgi:hypothetical protein